MYLMCVALLHVGLESTWVRVVVIDWTEWKWDPPLSSTVECWFQGGLVFVEQKEKSMQSPGLESRRSHFWVSREG